MKVSALTNESYQDFAQATEDHINKIESILSDLRHQRKTANEDEMENIDHLIENVKSQGRAILELYPAN